jgi:tetratricopeptide (TPR) repeat protein
MGPRQPLAILVLAIIAAAATGPTQSAPLLPAQRQEAGEAIAPAAREQLNVGYEALNKRNLDAAQKAFLQASKLDSRSALPLLGLAEVARLRNERAEIEKWLKQALVTAPNSADAQRAWGRYLFATGNPVAAEAALRRAAELAPQSATSYLDLGELYLGGLNQPRNAVSAYQRAVQLKSDHAGARNGLATALAALGETDRAIVEFEASAKLAPGNPLPLMGLATLYVEKKNYPKALETYDRVLKEQPDYVAALLARGDLYLHVRREPDRAIADYGRAVKLAPQDAAANFKLATAYHTLGKLDDAARYYRAAIAADGTYAIAYNNLAALGVERQQDLDGAVKAAKRAIELAPHVAAYHATLGTVYVARGDLDSAIAAFRTATEGKPPQAEHHYRLGLALDQKGRKPEAIAALKQALAINPEFANAADARRRLSQLAGG